MRSASPSYQPGDIDVQAACREPEADRPVQMPGDGPERCKRLKCTDSDSLSSASRSRSSSIAPSSLGDQNAHYIALDQLLGPTSLPPRPRNAPSPLASLDTESSEWQRLKALALQRVLDTNAHRAHRIPSSRAAGISSTTLSINLAPREVSLTSSRIDSKPIELDFSIFLPRD